jgi:hypothetical protein
MSSDDPSPHPPTHLVVLWILVQYFGGKRTLGEQARRSASLVILGHAFELATDIEDPKLVSKLPGRVGVLDGSPDLVRRKGRGRDYQDSAAPTNRVNLGRRQQMLDDVIWNLVLDLDEGYSTEGQSAKCLGETP